jgi:hypothetical protein
MADKETFTDETTLHPRYPGWCSFCRKSYKEVGPLAEGPDEVYICFVCALSCASMIQGECERKGIPLPNTQKS